MWILNILNLISCVWMFCLHAILACLVSVKARRGHRTRLRWSCRQLWAPCGCWELNANPLEEQPVLFSAQLSFPPWDRRIFTFGYVLPNCPQNICTNSFSQNSVWWCLLPYPAGHCSQTQGLSLSTYCMPSVPTQPWDLKCTHCNWIRMCWWIAIPLGLRASTFLETEAASWWGI